MGALGGRWPSEVQVQLRRLPPALPVILPLVRRVGVARIVDRCCPMRERRDSPLSHGDCVEFLVLHLLQSAHRQPLYRLAEWAAAHSVEALYGCPPEAFNDDRFGRMLDELAPSIDAVQGAVVTAALQQFAVDVQAIHWDLTHVTFSGAYEEAALIAPGYGDGRLHEKQLKVSLHVTSDGGLPVHHQVLSGRAHQAPFAPAMLEALQAQFERSDLIVISDSAGINYETIARYERQGAHFIAPLQLTPAEKQRLADVPPEAFTELRYRRPGAPEERYSACDTTWTVARQKHPEPRTIRALVVYSTARARHDAAARAKELDRCLQRLTALQGFLRTQARYRRVEFAHTQIEKAIPPALCGAVHCQLRTDTTPFTLTFDVDAAALHARAQADGRYVVATDQTEPSADEIFERYKRQTIIEHRHRNFKSHLQVQPLWLHKEERILALLLIFVLALLIYTLLERCSVRAGLSTRYYPKMTARELVLAFQTVDCADLRIRGQPPSRQLHLSADQQRLLRRLGFPNPIHYLTQP
jgi:hypothetical protein